MKVLVTGGSEGIGLAIAPEAVKDGADVSDPAAVRKAEEGGGIMAAEAVAQFARKRAGRGGMHIVPNRTSRILFALSRLSPDLAQSLVRAPGPGMAR